MKFKTFSLSLLTLVLSLCLSSYSTASLENILLIINYNHAHYESIPLLKSIYSPYFKNIVFYGPEGHEHVHECRHQEGYYSYITIADAMMRYPTMDGYLFLMDDCILNAWLLKECDTSTIWFSDISSFRDTRGTPISLKEGVQAYPTWVHWDKPWGYSAIQRAFDEMNAHDKSILEQNWGSDTIVAAYSDLLYIPASYKDRFIDLAVLFGKNNVFLEIALPTITACLASKKSWLWLPGYGTNRQNCNDFKKDLFFNHPIKLSDPKNRTFIANLFARYQ